VDGPLERIITTRGPGCPYYGSLLRPTTDTPGWPICELELAALRLRRALVAVSWSW
jgi:hypothetical protein